MHCLHLGDDDNEDGEKEWDEVMEMANILSSHTSEGGGVIEKVRERFVSYSHTNISPNSTQEDGENSEEEEDEDGGVSDSEVSLIHFIVM